MFLDFSHFCIERAKKEQKTLPVCQKAQQGMRKITTQFYDNHRQTTHEERKNGIAIVETRRERIRYYCFACRTTYRKSSIKPPASQISPLPLISPPLSGEESL